ncbi:MAG: hypothetical protein ACJ75R_04385 [Solirubrobacterales bacterium]
MRLSPVALAILVASVVIAVATVVFVALGATEHTPADETAPTGIAGISFVVASVAFACTGAVVASRVPHNPIGWVLCLTGLLLGIGTLTFEYADYTIFVSPGALPGGHAAASVQNVTVTPCLGLVAVVVLLFPDGHLPSRRWRPALLAAVLGSTLLAIGYAFRSGPLDPPFDQVDNPFGFGSFATMDALTGIGWLLSPIGVAAGAVALVRRLRRTHGAEQEQLKWLGLVAVAIGIELLVNFATFILNVEGIDQVREIALGLTLAAFPIAAGVAILRYRLYDIDVVINRTLVYGALTATLAAVYVGSVLVLQLILNGATGDSSLAVAASTLAVAALFRPARSQIQEAVDRRFYRRRYDARVTLEDFAGRLRDQVDLAALDAELRGVVAETMHPAHVSLWLRAPEVRT